MASVRPACESAASAKASAECHKPRRGSVSEQGERARLSTIAEVLETDEAKGLLEAGREAGTLNTEEIALALGELELDAAQIDDFYHALEELQIEVVDSAEEAASEAAPVRETREVTTD